MWWTLRTEKWINEDMVKEMVIEFDDDESEDEDDLMTDDDRRFSTIQLASQPTHKHKYSDKTDELQNMSGKCASPFIHPIHQCTSPNTALPAIYQ